MKRVSPSSLSEVVERLVTLGWRASQGRKRNSHIVVVRALTEQVPTLRRHMRLSFPHMPYELTEPTRGYQLLTFARRLTYEEDGAA